MQRRDTHEEGRHVRRDAQEQESRQQQHHPQEQQELDPFGLPLAGAGAPKEELDLDDLTPAMRSVAVAASRPGGLHQPGLVVVVGGGGSGALPSYHERHRGAYLYRESPKVRGSEPATSPFPAPGKVGQPTPQVPVLVRPAAMTAAGGTGTGGEGGPLAAPDLPFDTALFPLERCHYYTNKTGPELFEGIEAALQETGVSFAFAPAKFKFTCEYLAGGVALVKFVCRAYFVPEDGRTVVEFQRRSGCCIACAKVVEAVRNTLLVREGNAAAAPVPIKPFKARPLTLPECAAHSPSSSASSSSMPRAEQKEHTQEAAEAEAALRARQQEQQCKVMEDLQACLAAGRDDVLDGFAQVLVPLSQLSPEHLLSDLAYADLLAQLAGRASAGSARLAALSCLANLAASCFGVGAAAGSGSAPLPVVRRDVSSDDEDAAGAAAAARRQLASGAGKVEAWFGRSLGAAVAVMAAPQGEADPHVRREAARALMHAANGPVGAGVLRGSDEGLAALQRLAGAPSDRLLQQYAKAALQALKASA